MPTYQFTKITDRFQILGEHQGLLKVRRIEDGSICVIKKMDIPKERQTLALNTIRTMAIIQNDNLIRFKESFYDEINAQLCIAMEIIEIPEVKNLIVEAIYYKSFIQESILVKIFKSCLSALNDLHSENISHRYICPTNVFFDQANEIVKLGDFTDQAIIKDNNRYDIYYYPPEMFLDLKMDYGPP